MFCAALLANRWLKPAQLVVPGLSLGLVVTLLLGAL